ncbi:uncharacterized protein LOC126836796 [Adelges cooleyi]|uniref:uncharacterized protein LOC126836796 n=1 Tax=Adelges cooleyi TaxID=133065 RepID=UPI00217F789B|nr:uncharacterized protein LOC126836796 [Adelges cooleyi]
MIFKVSILLLFFILAASCIKTDPSEASSSAGPREETEASSSAGPKEETEAKMLEDSFNDCLKWCSEGLNYKLKHINFDLFIYYMGRHWQDIEVTENYFEDHPESIEKLEKIDLTVYCDLLKYYCARVYPYYTVQRCAEMKKNTGIISPLKEVAPSLDAMVIAQKNAS